MTLLQSSETDFNSELLMSFSIAPLVRQRSIVSKQKHFTALSIGCQKEKGHPIWMSFFCLGGEGGIRTHGDRKATVLFESTPIVHSGTSPFLVMSLRDLFVYSNRFTVYR